MAQYAIAIAPYTTYPFNAFNTACIVALASPNNIRVFSSKQVAHMNLPVF
jgi:hypothetical protein